MSEEELILSQLERIGWYKKIDGVWWRETPHRTSIVIRKNDEKAITAAYKFSQKQGWLGGDES